MIPFVVLQSLAFIFFTALLLSRLLAFLLMSISPLDYNSLRAGTIPFLIVSPVPRTLRIQKDAQAFLSNEWVNEWVTAVAVVTILNKLLCKFCAMCIYRSNWHLINLIGIFTKLNSTIKKWSTQEFHSEP